MQKAAKQFQCLSGQYTEDILKLKAKIIAFLWVAVKAIARGKICTLASGHPIGCVFLIPIIRPCSSTSSRVHIQQNIKNEKGKDIILNKIEFLYDKKDNSHVSVASEKTFIVHMDPKS